MPAVAQPPPARPPLFLPPAQVFIPAPVVDAGTVTVTVTPGDGEAIAEVATGGASITPAGAEAVADKGTATGQTVFVPAPTERYAQSLAAQGATTAFSPVTTIQAGSAAFLLAGCAATKLIASIVDSKGNTWTVDKTNTNGVNQCVSIASANIATAITPADTITITWSAATSLTVQVLVEELANVMATPFDQSAVQSGGGVAMTVGPTGTLAQAVEIVWLVAKTGNVAATLDTATGWLRPTTPNLQGLAVEYQVTNATAAVTFTSSWSGNINEAALLATYKVFSVSTSGEQVIDQGTVQATDSPVGAEAIGDASSAVATVTPAGTDGPADAGTGGATGAASGAESVQDAATAQAGATPTGAATTADQGTAAFALTAGELLEAIFDQAATLATISGSGSGVIVTTGVDAGTAQVVVVGAATEKTVDGAAAVATLLATAYEVITDQGSTSAAASMTAVAAAIYFDAGTVTALVTPSGVIFQYVAPWGVAVGAVTATAIAAVTIDSTTGKATALAASIPTAAASEAAAPNADATINRNPDATGELTPG